jgi:hypothetical protein
VSLSLAIRQDCCGKSPCLTRKILVHPASPGYEYRFLFPNFKFGNNIFDLSRFARRHKRAATAKHSTYSFRPFASEVIKGLFEPFAFRKKAHRPVKRIDSA